MQLRENYTIEEIIGIMRDEYVKLYEQEPTRFDDETRIFSDLHANIPDSTYALQWRSNVARKLKIRENALPKPQGGHDYTIGELVDIVKSKI